MAISVLLADDSEPFRAAVAEAIGASADLRLVASVGGGADAVAAVLEHRPDVAVLDVDMPDGGTALVARLLVEHPALRVMCLSGRDDVRTVLAMLQAGVTAYVGKSSLDEDLAVCIRRCAAGVLFVHASCADAVRARIASLLPAG